MPSSIIDLDSILPSSTIILTYPSISTPPPPPPPPPTFDPYLTPSTPTPTPSHLHPSSILFPLSIRIRSSLNSTTIDPNHPHRTSQGSIPSFNSSLNPPLLPLVLIHPQSIYSTPPPTPIRSQPIPSIHSIDLTRLHPIYPITSIYPPRRRMSVSQAWIRSSTTSTKPLNYHIPSFLNHPPSNPQPSIPTLLLIIPPNDMSPWRLECWQLIMTLAPSTLTLSKNSLDPRESHSK